MSCVDCRRAEVRVEKNAMRRIAYTALQRIATPTGRQSENGGSAPSVPDDDGFTPYFAAQPHRERKRILRRTRTVKRYGDSTARRGGPEYALRRVVFRRPSMARRDSDRSGLRERLTGEE